MKYFIAYPGPIEREIKNLNKCLNIQAVVCDENNQVATFESDLSFEELEKKVEETQEMFWLLKEEDKKEWYVS